MGRRVVEGQTGQIFPVVLFIILGTLAIGLALFQVGRASAMRADAQTAADAASLAAVRNLRDQIDRLIAAGQPATAAAIDPVELRSAADGYARRNDAEIVGFEHLGADVRVQVRTVATLGDTARPIDAQDKRGTARARASMSLLPTVLDTGFGPGADPGAIGDSSAFSDDDFKKLERELGDPPFDSGDVVTVGRFLQAHGLRVAENSAFGGITTTAHGHYGPSDHYNDGAIDVNSPAGDAAEAPIFDEIAPRLAAMGWHVLWRVPGHAPGDNSHMHVDIGAGGLASPVPVLAGGGGDIISEIRLVSWEGGATPLELSIPTTGNPFGAPDMRVACEIYRVGGAMNVSDKIMLAAFEAAIVESGVHNLNYGDADSHGVFQQQYTQGWGTLEQTMNVTHASQRFFQAALAADRGQPAHILAQDVQRSAFPERYGERAGQAAALIERVKQSCG